MKTIFDIHRFPFSVKGAPGEMHYILDGDNQQVAQCKSCETAHAICDELNTIYQCEYMESA